MRNQSKLIVCTTLLMVGCQKGATSSGETPLLRAPDDAIPASVPVAGGEVTLGTRIGRERKAAVTTSFRLSRFPILVSEWQQCMSAGACAAPGAATSEESESEEVSIGKPTWGSAVGDVPVTAVTLAQAEDYCQWVRGAHVPTIEQWLLAARGPTVRRFSWGDTREGCTHRSRVLFSPTVPGACCERDCADPTGSRVGLHPAGDSPVGVSDILLTDAELIRGDASSPVASCRGEGGCIVTGLEPGAIDWVFAAAKPPPQASTALPNDGIGYRAGFRCAWVEEVSK